MRDRAGALLAVVIGVTIIVFVLSDSLGGGKGQNRQSKKYYEIATIDGQSFSYQEFEARMQNLSEIYKMSGTTQITESLSETMREQVWTQMVEEKLLGEEMSSIGIGVSADEVDDMVFGDEPHPIVQQLFANQETGVLDKSFLVNFLKATEFDPQSKAYWLYFEDEIVNSKSKEKLSMLISKALYVTGKQVEYETIINSNSVDFSFVMQPFSAVPDSALVVSQKEIEDYFNKNKESYLQDPVRSMEYIEFEVLASVGDIKETEDQITGYIEEFKTDDDPVQFINLSSDTRHFEVFQKLDEIPEIIRTFVSEGKTGEVFGPYVEDEIYKLAKVIEVENRPDSVHVRHILLTTNRFGTREAAKLQADSLKFLIESGSDFAVLAMINSDDQGSAQLGGDLGWFAEGQMITPFNNACFENSKGDLTIAETTLGYHLIEILDQKGMSEKYHLGIIDRSIEPSSATYQDIYSAASRFAGLNNTYEKFNAAVEEEAALYKKLATNLVPEEKLVAGLESPRYLIMSLFESEDQSIILDRSEQAVFELGNKFIIAYCSEVKDEGYADIESVESDIRYVLLKDKKAGKMAEDIKEKIEGLDNIDDISAALNLTVQEATSINFNSFSIPAAGIEPAVISAAVSLDEGGISAPIKGENGVFVIAVNSVMDNPAAQTEDVLKTRLSSNLQVRAIYEAFEALKGKSEIKDMRYKFY
jgi:peptidyl-prolyl cis-trans isomerase D